MTDAPKINASPALEVPLALGAKGVAAVMQAAAQYPVAEKITKLTAHPALEKAKAKQELLWALFGFGLILHGAQFRGLLLCFHVVSYFFFEKVKTSVMAVYGDVSAARDKLQADGPAETSPEAKAEPANKHSKKRDSAKAGPAATADDAAMAKKALKAMDVEKLSSAAMDLFVAAMCCLLVLHGGLAQRVALGHALVLLVSHYVSDMIHFPGHEDLEAWTQVFVRFALYAFCMGLSLLALPLALAMYASLFGASFACEYVLKFAEAKGKVPAGSSAAGSMTFLMALGGLAGFGTLWQFWTYLGGGGMAWYFQALYLPAVVAEGVLGLF